MKVIIAVLFSWYLCCESVSAQSAINLVSSADNQSVEGALVTISKTGTRIQKHFISGQDGKVQIDIHLPFIVEVRHSGFKRHLDTLKTGDSYIVLTPTTTILDKVVVTGQYQPQSLRNSVYQVKTIGADEIFDHGSNSVVEALTNELNIQFSRDNATGSSGISLQGLSGQYVKILLDGIPMTGRSGVGNEIDLGQIDIQNVASIEIIEGPMAVNYGADALAGVINIITKQKAPNKISLNLDIQEESVGKEYSLKQQGVHSKALSLGYKINEHLHGQVSGRINNFGGWTGSSEGRQHDWYPKSQQFGSSFLKYSNKKFSLKYRIDLMAETLENLGAINANNPFKDPFAIDEEYQSKRWSHQVQSEFDFAHATLNSMLSFSSYQRLTRQFKLNLETNQATATLDQEQDTITYQALNIRETLNNCINSDWINLQLGIDFQRETAAGTTLSQGTKTSNNTGLFSSAEVILGRFKIRPGIRFSLHNIFPNSTTPSINFKYAINDQYQLRWSYGRGFRVPSVRELYHEFIDSNHNIQGNSNLKPETSHSWNINLSSDANLKRFAWDVNFFYTQINNQITYFTPELANQGTSYINLLEYKTTGGNLNGTLKTKWVDIKSGISYIGLYQRLSETQATPTFLFSPKVNAQLTAHHKSEKLPQYSLFYSFTGSIETYQIDDSSQPQLNTTDSFHLLDATITEKLNHGLSLSIGIKNLLGVTTINSGANTGVHGNNNGQRSLSYGRSYFLKINYQINK